MPQARPTALFLTQTLPARHGFGSALRIGHWVESLARTHAVTLMVVSTDPAAAETALAPEWRDMCADVCVRNLSAHAVGFGTASLSRFATAGPRLLSGWPMPAILAGLSGWRDAAFDLAVVSRLRLMPVWQALVGQAGLRARRAVLDLDDIESVAYERIVRILGAARLGAAGMTRELDECRKLEQAEAAAHGAFDRVVVCSSQDREKLEARFGTGKAAVVPNAVRMPGDPATRMPSVSQGHLLFVGSLDYVPNADAVAWLAGEFLPAMRAAVQSPPRLFIVGRRPVEWMGQMAAQGTFQLFANVADVAPYYAGAMAAIVPIRAGGGTRIKILEAMSLGVPVVSTRLGAEGLEARDGENILLAETAAEFAAAVARLRSEAGLGDHIAGNARRFVESVHGPAAFAAAVEALAG